ncbi:ap family 2 [Seiridium cupressi]
MEIKRLRTLWGVEPGKDMSEWDKLFPELVKIGFDGIEIDTANLQPPDFPKLRALCDKHGLAITALIFSSWPQYVGPRPKGLTPDDHLKFYREQIKQASVLKPLKINAHSGSLRITLDISHWVVVSERLLDTSEEDIALIEQMVPHVEHIHARIGTTQASQCPEPMNPAFREEREFFERTWLRVLEHRLKSNDTRPLTFVPEYG